MRSSLHGCDQFSLRQSHGTSYSTSTECSTGVEEKNGRVSGPTSWALKRMSALDLHTFAPSPPASPESFWSACMIKRKTSPKHTPRLLVFWVLGASVCALLLSASYSTGTRVGEEKVKQPRAGWQCAIMGWDSRRRKHTGKHCKTGIQVDARQETEN